MQTAIGFGSTLASMIRRLWNLRSTALLTCLVAAGATQAEDVAVPGTATTFPSTAQIRVGEQTASVRITGTAMRKKAFFNVYAIAIYVDANTAVKTPEELVKADVPKMIHLKLEREVPGDKMAESLGEGMGLNDMDGRFAVETKFLTDQIFPHRLTKGTEVIFVHQPGVGLTCTVSGKDPFEIRNPEFTAALMNIWLGRRNIDGNVKAGLTSMLRQR